MDFKRLALFLATAVLPAAAQAAPFINGDFAEGPTGCSGFCTLDAGSAAITGWVVSVGSVDYAVGGPSGWQDPPLGGYSIDLDGYLQPGGLRQSFDTVPGQTYSVTFEMSGNPDPSPPLKTMTVTAGSFTGSFSYDTATNGTTRASMKYLPMSFTFTATGATTVLTFTSTDNNNSGRGPVIGDVSMTAGTATIYSFTGSLTAPSTDGAGPSARLTAIPDGSRRLFGTTQAGGANLCKDLSNTSTTCGTAFVLMPPTAASPVATERPIFHFSQAQGWMPSGQLTLDSAKGLLFGATRNGGSGCGAQGCGVVFSLSVPTGSGMSTETVLHRFSAPINGTSPNPKLAEDSAGALYGTTTQNDTVFKLAPPATPGGAWTFSVLHRFTGTAAGSFPNDLSLAADGTIYGTTAYGGVHGGGVLYQLKPPVAPSTGWTAKILHSFGQPGDGVMPSGALAIDNSDGSLYGATAWGGVSSGCPGSNGCGTVFKLTPPAGGAGAWQETILYEFKSFADGAEPLGDVIRDVRGSGTLYGVNHVGGGCAADTTLGCGTVFSLAPPAGGAGSWAKTTLFAFPTQSNGVTPEAGLYQNAAGALFGTANQGGTSGVGIIYEIIPEFAIPQ